MLKFIDGFDSYSAAGDLLKKYSNASAGFSSSGGRFGGGALTLAVNQYVNRIFTATAAAEVAFAFAFKASAKPTNTHGFFQLHHQASGFDGWNTNGFWLQINTNGTISTYYNYGGNSTLTSATDICDTNWHWIEGRIKVADLAGGVCQLYIDGVLEINFSGDTNNNSNPASIDRFLFKNAQTGGQTFSIEDFVLYDTAAGTLTGDLTVASNFPLGDCKIETLRPTGAGTTTQLTPSTGSNYACVDEAVANGDTDYVQSGTNGHIDTYAFGDLATTPSAIKTVAVNVQAKNVDVGTISLKGRGLSSGNNAVSDAKTLSGTYATLQFAIPQDPNTSAAWAGAGVNAAEFGIEVVV